MVRARVYYNNCMLCTQELEDFNMVSVKWVWSFEGATHQIVLRHGRRSGIRKIYLDKARSRPSVAGLGIAIAWLGIAIVWLGIAIAWLGIARCGPSVMTLAPTPTPTPPLPLPGQGADRARLLGVAPAERPRLAPPLQHRGAQGGDHDHVRALRVLPLPGQG